MKRLVVVFCVVGLNFILHAQNLTISGGSEHSVMICGKGLVYAWGNNKIANPPMNNLLGLKDAAQAAAAFVTKPTEVQLPTGVTFKQVDAGSGAFNIALACNNVVYMWGANDFKQLGQGNSSTAVSLSVPTPVVKGATPGSTAPGMSAYLGNATFVSASTSTAYAILEDKRVVAWGSNGYKQLGNPAVTAATWGEPTYMKMKATATSPIVDITNVIFLDAGDEQVLALVDDGVIGDGVGTVYSCGGSAYNAADLVLGRPATNTDVFMPVLKQDGTPLSNIKMVSTGDSHGIAVDATTGYVWSWGNDGWGCLTGTTFPNPSTQGNRASRVVSGEYKTISGLDYLTNVKQVGGGRGFTVAVTNDGYVLTWGNNENNGGNLGSGSAATNSCTTGPQFVRYASTGNPIVNDGVSVSDGDNWGFLINKSNQYFAWGYNAKGQLGDNSVTTRNYAVPITNNIPCDIPNPCPKADMPPYYNVCPGQPFGLYAGFAPPTGKTAMYQYKWFFGTSMTGPWTPITGTTHTITVSNIGWYKVEIDYIGSDIPCDACQTSIDVVELRAIEANFYDPIKDGDTLFYCGNYADVKIKQKTASPTDQYKWYPTLTSTTSLGSSIGTSVTTLNKTGFTDVVVTDSIYRVWVEDVSSFLVTAARETGSFSGAFVNKESYGVDKDQSKITFTLTSTVKLKKVKFRQQAWGASVIDIVISGGTLATPVNVTTGDNPPGINGAWVTVTADFNNLELGPGTYTLSNNKPMELWNGNNTAVIFPAAFDRYGVVDPSGQGFFIINGKVVSVYGKPNAYPGWFDFEFESGSNYPCGRVPVLVFKKCPPCKKPLDITISSTDTDNYLCPAGSTTLTTTPNQANATDFDFEWFKGSITSTSITSATSTGAPVTGNKGTLIVNSGGEGTYYVRVKDKANPTAASCFKEASIIIRDAVKPTYTITGGGTFCEGEPIAPVMVNFTAGVQPYSITSTGPGAGVKPGLTGPSYNLGTTAGTYTLSAISDLYCTGDAIATQTKTITINPIPEATITANKTKYCGTTSDVTLTVTPKTGINLTGASYKWYRGTTLISGATSNTLTSGVTTGSYTVEITLNNCTYTTPAVVITGYDRPEYTITGNGSYCPESTSKTPVVITFTKGTAPFTFDEAVTGTGKSSATATYTITNPAAGTYIPSNIVDANGCTGVANTASVTVTDLTTPNLTIAALPNSCDGVVSTVNIATYVTAAAGTRVYSTDKGTITSAGLLTLAGAGLYTITVELTGSVAPGCKNTKTATLNVWENPSVSISPATISTCSNVPVTVTANATGGSGVYTGTGAGYTWTDASNSLSSTIIAAPSFQKSVATNQTYPISVQVTDNRGCKGSANTSVQVRALPTATLSASQNPVCIDAGTVTITATPSSTGGVGTWSGATKVNETTATFDLSSLGTITSPTTQVISYKYVASAANGSCEMAPAAQLTLTVNPQPQVVMQSASTCSSIDNVNLRTKMIVSEPTGTGTFTGYTPATTGVSLSPTGIFTHGGKNGVYTISYSFTANGCTKVFTQTFTVNANLTPDITANPGFEVCQNQSIQLGISGGPFASQTWSGSAAPYLGGATTIANPSMSGAPANTYTISAQVTDANGCTGTATKSIIINSVPTVTLATPDNTHCVSETTPQVITATISPATTVGTGTWSANVTKTSETTATFTPSVAGATASPHTITYNFTSNKGCAATAVTQQMIVYALPTVTITRSREHACESGNNSSVITFTTTGTTGGTSVFSSSTASVNSSTGALDPTAAANKPVAPATVISHTVKLDYTDANNCKAQASTTVDVHALPTVSFGTNPATKCVYDAPFTLNVNPIAVAPATGIFGGSVSSATFTPATATIGTNPITYTYRDAYGCEQIANYSISVVKIDVPTVTAPNPKTIVVGVDDSFSEPANVHASGTYTTEWMDASCNTLIQVGGIYTPGLTATDLGANQTKTFTYKVRQHDAVSGCVSECTDAILTLSRCPALTPSAVDPYYCVGESGAVTATAVPQGTQGAGDKLTWFANSDKTGMLNDGTTYTSTLTTTAATSQKVYVAQWNQANACYSAAKEVTIRVVDNPTVSLSIENKDCATAGIRQITTVPSTGTLTETSSVGGLNIAARTWDPMAGGAPSPSKTLNVSYVVSETQPDGKVCSTTKTASATSHFMIAPTPTHKNWLIDDIDNIPADYMTATTSSTGTTISWYGSQSKTPILAANSFNYTPNKAALKAEVAAAGNPDTYVKTYWITQTNVQGCESEPVAVTLTLVKCPFMAPSVSGTEKCAGEVLPAISASTTNTVDTWKWYKADQTTPIANATASYTHGVSNTVAGTTDFYVSYVATETNTGKQCESPKSKVSVVVNPLPDFTIQLSKTGTICYDDSDVEISVIPNTGTTISSVNYDINTDPNRVQKSGIKGYINPDAPVMGYTIPGLYPIQINAEVTNQFGCKITKNITNSVRWTSIPTITNVTEVLDIANTNPITITATGMAVNWYNSASKTGSLATNTNSYTTSITRTTVSNTTLYATQTLDGCESQTALGTIQVIDCPFAAPDATSIAACPGLPLADITATTTNTAIQWKWFDESNTVLPTSTATLTHGVANTTETIKKFYVQYEAYDSGSGKTCWSPKKEVTVQVYKKPMVFFTDAVHTLCYDSGPHFLENIVNMGNGNPNITWTINGETTGIKNGVVDPTFNGAQSGNYTVEAIITDSKGCTSTETCIVRINYVPEPTPIGYFELKKPSTPVQVSVSGIVTTPIAGSVQWLNESGTVISTSNPYVTGLNSNTEIKTYAIARQKIGNCYSDTIQVPIQIIDCPVPSPQVNISPSATICNYDAVPQIQTSIGSTWLQGTRPTPVIPVEFRLYSQATGGVAISSNTTGNFTPVLANMSQGGNYDFWIAEYNPNVIPQGCESVLRTKVTIQVNKTPAVGIVGQKDVCEQTANAQLQIKDVLPNAVVEWYTSMPNIPSVTPPVAQGMYYTPSVTNVGTHTVYAVQRLNGCMSELAQVSFTIKPLPAPPVTLPASVCQGQPHVALQATGTGITWYQNANKTGVKLLTNSNTYIPTVDNTTTFYASQTVNECESSTAPVVYTVKSIPAKPIIQTKDKSCDTETEHILSVTPETGSVIRWYSSPDTSSYLTSGNEYKHQIQGVSGQKTYYARKFVDGCISDVSSKYFTIVPTPQPPVITNTTVCKQSNATLISDDNDNEWYSDQTLQTMVFKGRNYTVNQVISNQTLYVIKNKFTCTSSPVEANITVVNPTIDIGKNIEACVGDPVATLTAAISPAIQNAQDIVEWKINPGNAIIKSNAPVSLAGYITTADIRTDINYTITARYQVKLATATCYSNIDTLIYTVHKRAHTPIVFSNVICQGQSLEPLKALGTPNLTWTSNHPLIPSPVKGREYNFAQQGITTLPEGTYSFELIDESEFGCKSLIATPSITVAPAARTKIIGDSTVCEYTIEQLYTLEYVPQQPSSYKWEVTGKHVNYTKDANASNIRYVDWGKAGIDTLRVYERTFYGCDGYDELIVNIAEYPIAKFTYTMPGAVDVVWFSDSTIQKPIVEITDTGETVTIPISYTMYWNFDQLGETYYDRIVPYSQRKEIVEATGYTYGYKNPELMVENEYGCRSTYSKEINININAAIFVPTAFSPTNAAYSVHYFQPVGYNIKTCEIWIYDLWGNLVWYSNEVENGIFVGKWDGTYNGELLKADTYIWKMEAELLNGQSWNGKEAANGKISKFGSVALIR